MRGPVLHVTRLDDLTAYVTYLYGQPKISPSAWQSLENKITASAAYWDDAIGKDLYVLNKGFETIAHPAGIDCGLLIPVNSFDQFKRYLALYLKS